MNHLFKIFISFALVIGFQNAVAVPFKGEIDTKASKIQWAGSKIVGGGHHGTIDMESGFITFDNKKPVNGEVVVDMNTITDLDLKDPAYINKLQNHLKSDDFFSVSKFPKAKIVIKEIKESGDKAYSITGDLTIKDVTKSITFPATVLESTDQKKVVTAKITFDRTDFGVKYNSGKFFQNLGDKVIKDQVDLEITITVKVM